MSIKFVEGGLNLGEAAAKKAIEAGTALEVPDQRGTEVPATELADYGVAGATVEEWLKGISLDEYAASFSSAGLTDILSLVNDGITEVSLSSS